MEALVKIESSQFSKTMIFVFHPRHHQVTKSSQNTKIMELGYAPNKPRSIPFAPKLLLHHFGGICEDWVQPVFQNHDFRFSPNTPRSHKMKPTYQNHGLGYEPTMPRSIPFAPKLLTHYFGGICEDWVQPVFQNNDFRFSPHTPPRNKIKRKPQNHRLGFPPTMPRSFHFAPQLLPYHIGGICEDCVQPVFQNNDFRFSPHTPPSHKIKPEYQNHRLGFAPTMPRSTPFSPKLLPHDFGGICGDWIQPVFENHDFRFSPHTPPSHKIKPKHQNHALGYWSCLLTKTLELCLVKPGSTPAPC